MSSEPLVSVIVTTYNRVDMLIETIESILSQKYKNIEVLIIDDESDDSTEQMVKAIDDVRVFYYKIDHWGGPAKPRNFGIEKSSGEYICFCDDDDLWKENKIEKSLHYLSKKNLDFLFTDASFIDEFGNHIKEKIFSIKKLFPKFCVLKKKAKKLLTNNIIPLSSVIIKKDLLITEKFSEDKNLISQEDHHLWIRLNKKTRIYFLREKLIYYRIHLNGISKNKNNRRNVFIYKTLALKDNNLISSWDYLIMRLVFELKEIFK